MMLFSLELYMRIADQIILLQKLIDTFPIHGKKQCEIPLEFFFSTNLLSPATDPILHGSYITNINIAYRAHASITPHHTLID